MVDLIDKKISGILTLLGLNAFLEILISSHNFPFNHYFLHYTVIIIFFGFQLPGFLLDPIIFTTVLYSLSGLKPELSIYIFTLIVNFLVLLTSVAFGKCS